MAEDKNQQHAFMFEIANTQILPQESGFTRIFFNVREVSGKTNLKMDWKDEKGSRGS
jgi:hypothetical protein